MVQITEARGLGGGGGAGFTFGPADNFFGDTGETGDATVQSDVVAVAPDRATAEATRDTYFTANPTNLASYDASESINIGLFFVSGGRNVFIYQVRRSGSWADNGSTTAIPGRDGADGTANVPNLNAGEFVMGGPTAGTLVPASVRETSDMIEFDKSAMLPGGTISLEGFEISNPGGQLILTDTASNIDYSVASRPFTEASGSQNHMIDNFAVAADVAFQNREDETLTSTELGVNFTQTQSSLVLQWTSSSAVTGSGDFYIVVHRGTSASDPVHYRSHTPAQVDAGTVFTLDGNTVHDTRAHPVIFQANQPYFVRFVSVGGAFTVGGTTITQADIDGGGIFTTVGQQVPYYMVRFMTLTQDRVALFDEKEDALGNPTSNDQILSSQTDGTRSWIDAPSGGGGDITVEDEGTPLATAATTLNFTGAGVTASGTGATKTINIPGGSVGSVAAADVIVDDSGILASDGDDAQQVFESLKADINSLTGSALLTGRNFERVNTDLDINNTNADTYSERIILYAAGIDKTVTWQLPTSAEITTAGETFPYVFETIHLGGTSRVPASGDNRLNIDVKAGDTGTTIETSTGLINLPGVDMLRGDRIIWTKTTSGGNWFADRLSHDSSTFVLPSGVVEIRDVEIQDVTAIATELGSLTINKGDTFRVADADGGTYFGRDILQGDLLVALVDTPGLLTTDADDWTVLDSRQSPVPNDLLQLSRNLDPTGTRLDFTRNVFVDEANVISFNSPASNTPTTPYVWFDSNGDGIPEQRQFTNQALQFADLQGGTLSLSIMFAANQQSGFLPELTDIQFDYGGGNVFTFPLTGVDPQSGVATVDIQIPNADYSSILNTNCTITLNFIFRGATFIGTFTIMGLVNTLNGTLRQSVTDIANNSASMAEQRVNTRIDGIAAEIDNEGAALQNIQPRISPLKTVVTSTPEVFALFLDSTGADSFPSDLSTMSKVSADNPRFTGGDVALYVAVPGGNSYTLENITSSTALALDDAEATVSLGESVTFEGRTYFVYRVTSLTSGHVYEVGRSSSEEVVAWPDDIRNLQDDVQRIDAELEHAALNLPDALVNVLDNEVSVTEQTTPTVLPTTYNQTLGGTAAQTVFFESSPIAGSGGIKQSNALSLSTGDRANRKLLYIPAGSAPANQVSYVTAFDGASTNVDLISYSGGTYFANVFVPAKSAGSSTETVYPAPSSRVSGAGIWQTIPTLTFQNGVPVPEADELFFTRNLPSQSTTVTIDYRGHANGNIFGTGQTTLAGVGGTSETFANFSLNDGSEIVDVEVRWYPSSRQIRVSETSRVTAGLPTVNDIQVILSFDETRTIPATPATTRQVALEDYHNGVQVFAFRPATSGNLAIVGDRAEIDTGYAFTTLFGAGLAGDIRVANQNADFYDFEDFTPIHTTVEDLENHGTLPQYGLFETEYNHETTVVFDVALQAENSQGDNVLLGQELVLVASNNTRWRLSVDNSGTLITTQET